MILPGLKSQCQQDCIPSGCPRGESISLLFPASGGCSRSLAHSPFLRPQSQQAAQQLQVSRSFPLNTAPPPRPRPLPPYPLPFCPYPSLSLRLPPPLPQLSLPLSTPLPLSLSSTSIITSPSWTLPPAFTYKDPGDHIGPPDSLPISRPLVTFGKSLCCVR